MVCNDKKVKYRNARAMLTVKYLKKTSLPDKYWIFPISYRSMCTGPCPCEMRAHAVLSSLEFRVKQGKLSRAACKHSIVKLRGKQGGMLDFESQLRADSKRNTNRRSPISERELRRRPTNHRLFLPACLAALLSKVGQARIFKQAETT